MDITSKEATKSGSIASQFGRNFYVANLMEIFERLAWYGFFAVSSIYMTTPVEQGGVGFSNVERGAIQGIIPFFLYLLPVFTGAIADQVGYKKMFLFAFIIMAPGYWLLGYAKSFNEFFAALSIVALGAACFKPVVVGTVAMSTNENNRGLGFGIFYTMVNVGGFLGPLIAGYMRAISWDAVFMMSAAWILLNFIPLLLWYKPSITTNKNRRITDILNDAQTVLGNARFALLSFGLVVIIMLIGSQFITGPFGPILLVGFVIGFMFWERRCTKEATRWWQQRLVISQPRFALYLLILTGFWTVYNQLFYTLPIFIRDYVDTSDLVQLINAVSPQVANFLSHLDIAAIEKLTMELLQTDLMADTMTSYRAHLAHLKILLPMSQLESINTALRELQTIPEETRHVQLQLFLASLSQYRQVNPEYLINLDFAAIVLFQVAVSQRVAKKRAISVLIAGLIVTALAFVFACLSGNWLSGGALMILVIVLIALGEMLTSPKSQEYVATFAPKGAAATYMGYYFVSMALGFLFAGFLSGWSYDVFVIEMHKPELMWMLFSGIALSTALAFYKFDKKFS
ncbi:MFS transporter [Pseudoalteromonas xiamenensis]